MHKAKPITVEEARYLFMKHVADCVNYWDKESRTPDTREKLEGLAFSILTMLDGCSMGLPGYEVRPLSKNPDDTQYAIENGFDYYPEESYDIIGDKVALHEIFHQYMRDEIPRPKNLHDFGAYLAEEAKKFHRY